MMETPTIIVTDEGEGWNYRITSKWLEEDMHRIITAYEPYQLKPGVYKLVKIE
jgi:hypothetical protein